MKGYLIIICACIERGAKILTGVAGPYQFQCNINDYRSMKSLSPRNKRSCNSEISYASVTQGLW